MGLFDRLMGNKRNPDTGLHAFAKGRTIMCSEISDKTFAEEMLGRTVAILPESDELYAPADGEITLVFDTKHAIGMTTVQGAEILIHVGLDTVDMNGEGFDVCVKTGQKVKQGELLMRFSREKIQTAGHDTVCMMIITNSDDLHVEGVIGEQDVEPDTVIVNSIK